MVPSPLQLATVASTTPFRAMVWLQVTELVCASVAVQVRWVLLTSLPLTARLASTNVTVRFVSHVSLKTGVPKAGAAGHWMVASAGQLVTVGAELSMTVMVWEQVTELVCASVAVQVRCVLLTSLPMPHRLAYCNVTVRLLSHVSLKTGVPKAGVAGHWMVASGGQLVTVGALL